MATTDDKVRALAVLGADAINVLDWAVRLAASVVETLPDGQGTEDAAEQLAAIQPLLVSAYREAAHPEPRQVP